MRRKANSPRLLPFILFLMLMLLGTASVKSGGQPLVSKPGLYSGYSKPIYNEWKRISQYVTVRDGTRLAVDIFMPTENGQPVDQRLPVIWAYYRYHRAELRNGAVVTQLDQMPWLKTVLKHGYVIAVVDARGSGASFGMQPGVFSRKEALDAYDLTEWFAAQPWCSGNIGMYGRSYMGIMQYLTAGTMPPHLKAIFPEMAMFDLYSFVYDGGVFRQDFNAKWYHSVRTLDTVKPVPPVDEDSTGAMLTQAIKEHQRSPDAYARFAALHNRNSTDKVAGGNIYQESSPASYLDAIKKSGVPVYVMTGWHDLWSRDALVWFNNLNNPRKIVIGPWHHTQNSSLDSAAEHLRWYDFWLKGIDNGIMKEPPIFYYTMGASGGEEWRSAWQWPLPNENPTRFYFQQANAGNLSSTLSGELSLQPSQSDMNRDDYIVNYTTTSGTGTRWSNGYSSPFNYPDMTQNDKKGLAYTSQPLTSEMEITGHPVIHLWVTSTAKDGDFFAYLEDVDENGYSHYITEGVLRASHRATSEPAFNYMGLPYHRGNTEDLSNLPREPVELVFDLQPTSYEFQAAHRIRVTITGADKDNTLTPELSPPPTVSIYVNKTYGSYIILPVIPTAPRQKSSAATVNSDSPESGGAATPKLMVISLIAAALLVTVLSTTFYMLKKRKRHPKPSL